MNKTKFKINRNLSIVDIGKLFFAYCVLAIHTSLFEENKELFSFFSDNITIYAVPFFFVASGFFVGRGIKTRTLYQHRQYILKRVKELFRLLCVWGMWYFFVETSYLIIKNGYNLLNAVSIELHRYAIGFWGGGLWFVVVLVTIFLLCLVSNKNRYYYILFYFLFTSFILFPFLQQSIYWQLYKKIFLTEYNFVFNGVYVIAGIVLGLRTTNCILIPRKVILFLFFLFWVTNLYLSTQTGFGILVFRRMLIVPTILCIFLFFYKTPSPYHFETLITCRNMSTVIYFSHITIKYGIQYILMKLYNSSNSIIVFVSSAILTSIFSLLILKKNRFSKVRFYLFNI